MTITFAWWFWPILILVLGFGYSVYDQEHSHGYLSGLYGALIFVVSGVAAVAMIIGHFL